MSPWPRVEVLQSIPRSLARVAVAVRTRMKMETRDRIFLKVIDLVLSRFRTSLQEPMWGGVKKR
jgi:hypothetical protein